jgi:hypothetical protein
VLGDAAWARGNPLYWVSSQGLESSQIPLVSRGWDAMRPDGLRLPRWFTRALGDPALLERCEVPSLRGGTLSIAGHETYDGRPSTVLLDRAPRSGVRERIVLASASPSAPERISFSGGLPADPGCGVSAAVARAVRGARITFGDAGAAHIPRPHATLDAVACESLLRAPAASRPNVPANLARLIAGRYRMTGRIAATLGVRGDRVGERVTLPWTLTPHCAGDSCRLGRLRAWSSEATTACGGPSADYIVWRAG